MDNRSWFPSKTNGVQLNYKLWSGFKDCLKEHSKLNVSEYIFSFFIADPVDFTIKQQFLEKEKKTSSLVKAIESGRNAQKAVFIAKLEGEAINWVRNRTNNT